ILFVQAPASTACAETSAACSARKTETLNTAPQFSRDFNNSAELGPLLIFGEQVPFFSAGETTLRAETQLIHVRVARGFVNATHHVFFRFERSGFGCN